jgi:hypothetical protein
MDTPGTKLGYVCVNMNKYMDMYGYTGAVQAISCSFCGSGLYSVKQGQFFSK